ncbi:aminotransferase class I/II-fold pyridoxal phosphate-dependent enzyme [Brevibacterium sp. R8603A2]|uniref:aminotransferase class I/II-fold pyridoxal phosphate-dependent enzyme n=1 Tax=Brevibacterium sp. R8603A2 TaxID=2929779 RepID=UPI001FFAB4B7|nr:aminotransferase class I/II-fold pyridoxal phosphate-dependent enzyme [Brevibacterium sp. R8603A2]
MPELMRAPLWHRMVDAAGLVRPDGTVGETIFGQMTQLAAAHGAVNLGQGAPGTDAPEPLVAAAADAMRAGMNQYAPGQGFPALIGAVAEQRRREYGQQVSTDEVLVTVGATEALTAAILALVPPGGEVIVFEPFYDAYPAAITAAGATMVTVPVLPVDGGFAPDGRADGPVDGGFAPDWEAFEAAVSESTAAIIVNTPHNPTGALFDLEQLRRIFAGAQRADAWVITDEVYEYLVFDGAEHHALAAHVDEPERVVSVSSAGKSFNITGWKVGWVVAAPEVRAAIQGVKQFLTFTAGSPLQVAVAEALRTGSPFPSENRDSLAARRGVLLAALRQVPGIDVRTPRAGYFVLVDFTPLTDEDAFALNERITREYGFTGIPVAALCRAGSPTAEHYRATIRYSFCKSPAEVEAATAGIARLARAIEDGTFTARPAK